MSSVPAALVTVVLLVAITLRPMAHEPRVNTHGKLCDSYTRMRKALDVKAREPGNPKLQELKQPNNRSTLFWRWNSTGAGEILCNLDLCNQYHRW